MNHRPSLLCSLMCALIRPFRNHLPRRFKRLLVLGSAYGSIASLERSYLKHAEELTKVLNLTTRPDSVGVPIKLHSVVISRFNELNVKVGTRTITLHDVASRELKAEEEEAMVQELCKSVPKSLQYSEDMRSDFFALLRFVNQRLIHN